MDRAKEIGRRLRRGPADSDRRGAQEAADRVRAALLQVDWAAVRRESERRGQEVQRRVRELTADVDWNRVGKTTGKVAALVAVAMATGELVDLDEATGAALDSAMAGDLDATLSGDAFPAGTDVAELAMRETNHAVQMAYVNITSS